MKAQIKGIISKFGLEIKRKSSAVPFPALPVEATPKEIELIELAGQFSMTGPVRMWALLQSLKHIKSQNLDGDLVECGVWRGGNLILMRKFADEFFPHKTVFGFDTFEGMSPATDLDVDYAGNKSADMMRKTIKDNSFGNIHAYCDLDSVRENLKVCSAYKNVRLLKGRVEDTLRVKNNLPKSISLLRLDTDWYESTKMELDVLFPRLVSGGVLIIDDYGHFKGAKKAVDDYFSGRDIWLHYVDYTCRLLIKS